jgi:hypothetical protein
MSEQTNELLAVVREIRGYEARLAILRSRHNIDTTGLEAELEARRAEAERRLKELGFSLPRNPPT